jgi:hypothetical protein
MWMMGEQGSLPSITPRCGSGWGRLLLRSYLSFQKTTRQCNEVQRMKRDMDLIRQIMIQVEANPHPLSFAEINIPDRGEEEISYHIDSECLGSAAGGLACSSATGP